MLKSTSNSKIKIPIINVLCWRISQIEENPLEIEIVPYQVSEHYKINPGTMCIYYGKKKIELIHIKSL